MFTIQVQGSDGVWRWVGEADTRAAANVEARRWAAGHCGWDTAVFLYGGGAVRVVEA
jgi:hypothetical protein